MEGLSVVNKAAVFGYSRLSKSYHAAIFLPLLHRRVLVEDGVVTAVVSIKRYRSCARVTAEIRCRT
jgi:hypothetical protein